MVVGGDRFQAGTLAVEHFSVDCVVLDDGFQHFSLQRDLDVVCLDAMNPWGGGRLLPAGLLREPLSSLQRASVIVLTKTDLVTERERENILMTLKNFGVDDRVLLARYRPALCEWGGKALSVESLKGKKVLAFSGIASPIGFEKTIEKLGVPVVQRFRFSDHHVFSLPELERVMDISKRENLAVVLTEKDAVRISGEYPFWVLGVEWEWVFGEKVWEERLKSIFEVR